MEHLEYIKRDIKAVKKHITSAKNSNHIYLIPLLENKLEELKRMKFNCELKQFKDFI
tara:strand:- start:4100 stop:4270 length:171 start_codon:yes stop_codon:yes gene_type:complete